MLYSSSTRASLVIHHTPWHYEAVQLHGASDLVEEALQRQGHTALRCFVVCWHVVHSLYAHTFLLMLMLARCTDSSRFVLATSSLARLPQAEEMLTVHTADVVKSPISQCNRNQTATKEVNCKHSALVCSLCAERLSLHRCRGIATRIYGMTQRQLHGVATQTSRPCERH